MIIKVLKRDFSRLSPNKRENDASLSPTYLPHCW